MRQPAVSGPENEISPERVEYDPAKLPGAITREFGIPSRNIGLFPPRTFGPPPLPGLFADPAQTDLVSRTSPESLSKSPSVQNGHAPSAFGAVCYCEKKLRTSIGSHSTPLSFCYCKGVGSGGRAVVAQTVSCRSHRFEGFGR